jgi:hypothetical protein
MNKLHRRLTCVSGVIAHGAGITSDGENRTENIAAFRTK